VRSRPSRRPGPRDRRHDAERLGQQGHLPDQPRATRYVKKTAQGPGAESALNFDISVTKDEFNAGERSSSAASVGGDFAYVMSWGRRAERMARARVFLRNELVTTILEAGESGYWGSSRARDRHRRSAVLLGDAQGHPRDPSKKLRGSATWGNYQAPRRPSIGEPHREKVNAFQVADPTGHEFGFEYDRCSSPRA
jgi:hypothetical protein